ncbi:MAG: hypothetical protein KDB68_01895 [Planctomycetes bacterium]|nr:hypothetical protein [Planctomycetota bacterium]
MARRRKRKRFNFELRLGAKPARIAGVVFGVFMVAATIGCVVYTSVAPENREEVATPPERFQPEPLERLDRIEGWVPYWGDEAQIAGDAAKAGFTDLLFFHGSVDEDGSVRLEDTRGLAAGLAASGSARSWLTVTNHGGSMQGALIDNPDAHTDSLLDAYHASGCSHLDLDYESLNVAQAAALLPLASAVSDRLPSGARLSFTLQPVDDQLRPNQRVAYQKLLESPHVYTVRLMMYDYHWRGSLPGALYPLPAFERLLKLWAPHAHKLTMCLPLYGYDWARPEDTSIPKAEVVTLRDVRTLSSKPGFDAVWMTQEGELAARYLDGVTHMVALPSHRAIQARVELGLDWGVPGVSFWHLGCASPGPVVQVCARDRLARETITYDRANAWNDWLEPFKRRVCKVITGDGSRTLEQIGEAHGVSRSAMFRFNEQVTDGDLSGQTVFIPE